MLSFEIQQSVWESYLVIILLNANWWHFTKEQLKILLWDSEGAGHISVLIKNISFLKYTDVSSISSNKEVTSFPFQSCNLP